MKKSVLIAIIFCIASAVLCQNANIPVERLSVQQGLTDHYAHCMIQDHTGFLWIGGGNGLYRFDGYNFIYFKFAPGCNNCLPFNQVYAIEEDDLGMIWVMSQNGIIVFNPETEKSQVAYPFGKDILSETIVADNMDLLKDSQGRIWATNGLGLLRFSYKKNDGSRKVLPAHPAEDFLNREFIHLCPEIKSPDNIAQKIYEDPQGNIWAGCYTGLYVLRKNDTRFHRLEMHSDQFGHPLSSVWDILEQDEDTYWIIDKTRNFLMTNVKKALSGKFPDASALSFTEFELPDRQTAYCLYKDRDNNILIGADHNVFRLNGSDRKNGPAFTPLYRNLVDPNDNRINKHVHCILEDRTGMLWTTNYFYGILRFNLKHSQFRSYEKEVSAWFSNIDINHILKDGKENLWIGVFEGGLYKIQQGNGKVTRYDPGPPANNIICMEEISPDRLWVGIRGGIREFNTITGRFTNPLPAGRLTEDLGMAEVYDILNAGDYLHLATTNGLFVYNRHSKKLSRFSFTDNDTVIDARNKFLSPIRMKNGDILVGTQYDGIQKVSFDTESDKISLRQVIPETVLLRNNISLSGRYRLYEDSEGILWIVNKSGLHQTRLHSDQIKTHTLFNNIEFPEIWSIEEDGHSNLWMGTQYGLCMFNKKTDQVKIFTRQDGLPVTLHGYNTVYKDKQGQLYFGGIGGFYRFHPDSLRLNDSVPPIVITDFTLFNRSIGIDSSRNAILSRNITFTDHIELKHDQHDLSFEFAALDYGKPMENKFAYRLEGYQEEWTETDAKNRIATFTNLNPGTYVFRVKGCNSDGVWNEKGAFVTLIIHKPWWTTHFALFTYFLLLVMAFGAYIRWRFWNLNKEKAELEELVHSRTHLIEEQKNLLEMQNRQITELDQVKSRFFANISHEFRTPLSLIQSPVEELLADKGATEKQKSKLGMVQRNAHRLLDLVNQLLDISRIDHNKMKLELITGDVMKYLRTVASAFNSLAEKKSIRYVCHFPEEELQTWFDPDKVEKIATNLLSNAFKFTPEAGEIEMAARYIRQDDPLVPVLLEFMVRDTGQGIPAESLDRVFDRFYQVETRTKSEGGGTGIGLSLARDMARLLHGDIRVESKIGKGSKFTVHFPMGKKHLIKSEFILLEKIPGKEIVPPMFPDKEDPPIIEKSIEPSSGKPMILIVEDNPDIRIQLSDNLKQEYLLHEAADGMDGLKKAFDLIPDLIISDLMMPRMDGIVMCDKLKNDERTSHIPVIILTAKAALEDKIVGLQTGADDYIPKPFNMTELKARTANLIGQRKRLRERFSREITLEPGEISITPLDEQFLKRAIETVEKHMQDENFDLPEFREKMLMSRSTLSRKLHALTNQSPTEFIRTIRLKRAASLLKQNFGNVTEVSMEVGFRNLSYFNKSFKKLFGVTPAEYVKST